MDPQMLLGFAAVSVTLAMTPGADWAYSISAGLGRRRIAPAVSGLCAGYLVHTVLIVAGLAALIAARPELLSALTLLGAGYLLWLGIATTRSWRSAGFTADGATEGTGSAGDGHETEEGLSNVDGSPRGAVNIHGEAPEAAALQSRSGAGSAPVPGTAATLLLERGNAAGTRSTAGRLDFLKGLGTSGTNPKALLLYLALIPQFISPAATLPVPVQTGILGLSHFAVSVVVYSLVAAGSRRLLRSRPAAARGVTLASGVIMIALGMVLLAEQLPAVAAGAAQLAGAG